MRSQKQIAAVKEVRTILPVILRITFSLVMWTLGAMTITLAEAQTQRTGRVQTIPVDRARVENLQRWVDSGHDTWCRNARSVAAMALKGVSPEFSRSEIEEASFSNSEEKISKTKAVYTFHSVDGQNAYRVTLRRYRWQVKTAGSLGKAIWVPVCVEQLKQVSLD